MPRGSVPAGRSAGIRRYVAESRYYPHVSPTLEWGMSVVEAGTSLRVDLVVSNTGAERIYVCDGLLESWKNKFERVHRLIVMNEGEPGIQVQGVVKLVCGMSAADGNLARLYPPYFRSLEPGQRHEASYVLAWPLEAYHPQGFAAPIDDNPAEAQLYVDIVEGEPLEWRELPTDDSEPLRVPWLYKGQKLSTGRKRIPCP